MLRYLTALAFLGHALCLTDWEISQFKTTGVAESNTGAVGYVTVTKLASGNLQLDTNHIPDHNTGVFPNPNGKANPNPIVEQTSTYTVTNSPTAAAVTSCINMGTIGVAVNGVALFSPFDLEGDNAVEGPGAETFDSCDGHPTATGLYHYHQLPDCLSDNTPGQLIGVALDGFPVYGPVDEDGNDVTGAELDECNGRYVDGKYRYHVTRTFPYIMGCYRGTPPSAGNRRCDFALNTVTPAAGANTIAAGRDVGTAKAGVETGTTKAGVETGTTKAGVETGTTKAAVETETANLQGSQPSWTNAAGPAVQLGVWVLIVTVLLRYILN